MNLFEAFKALDALNEDTFAISDDGIAKLDEFQKDDEATDTLDIIDADAETEDDLQDSYVGKVILDCGVCHSKIYKDKEEVELNDDQTLANVGEECPFCSTSDGFKVIGEVADYSAKTAEEPVEETNTEDSEEPVEEGLLGTALAAGAGALVGSALSKREELDEGLGGAIVGGALGGAAGGPVGAVAGAIGGSFVQNKLSENDDLDELLDANINLDARGFGGKDNNVSVLGGKVPFGESADVEDELEEGIFGGNNYKDKDFLVYRGDGEDKVIAIGTMGGGNHNLYYYKKAHMKKNGTKESDYVTAAPTKPAIKKYKKSLKTADDVSNKLPFWVQQSTDADKDKRAQDYRNAELQKEREAKARRDAERDRYRNRKEHNPDDDYTYIKGNGSGTYRYRESVNEAVATLERPMSALQGTLSNVMTAHKDELATISDREGAIAFLDSIEPEVKNKGFLNSTKEKIARLPNSRISQFLYNIILKGDGMGTKMESIKEAYTDVDGVMGEKGAKYTEDDLKAYWDKENENDPVLANYKGNYQAWLKDTTSSMKVENLEEAAFSGGYASSDSINGGKVGGMGASTQPDNKTYLNRIKAKNPKLVDIITIKAKDLKPNMMTQAGQIKTAEVKYSGYHSKDMMYVVHTNGWDYFKELDADMEVMADLENKSEPFTGNYRDLLKMGLQEAMNESVNNVNVETDDSIVNVSSDENGKVTVTTEPNTAESAAEGDEVIAPVSPETEDAIVNGTDEEPVEDGQEVDAQVDEFDEESFDEVSESYLKEVYDNVTGFLTESVKEHQNSLIVEGYITFNNGKRAKTSFVLEAKDCTKGGTYRFVGSNKHLTEDAKPYLLTGKLASGKFICESLKYDYSTGSDVVSGTVKRG